MSRPQSSAIVPDARREVPGADCRSRCCAGVSETMPTTFPTSSSGSGFPPSGGSPSCRATRWPIASARLGLRARRLARGEDEPLRPRPVREAIAVELELPEAVSGQQLERSLELLISRCSRTVRDAAGRCGRCGSPHGSPRAADGGVRARCGGQRRSARLADALLPHLACSPAPAATLRLEAVALGPETGRAADSRAPSGSGASGSPRRCARHARPPGPTRCCGCSRWIRVAGAGAARGPDAVSGEGP